MTVKNTKKKKKRRKYRLVWPWNNPRYQQQKAAQSQSTGKKKKRKFRFRKLKKEAWFAIAGAIALLLLIFVPQSITNNKLKTLGYSKAEIKAIKSEKLSKTLIDNQWYSPYLASSITDGTVNKDYMVYYTVVDSERGLDATDFLLISRLKDKGYIQDQILKLYKDLKDWEITPLLVMDYQYDERDYIQDCLNHEDVNSRTHFELSGNYYTPYENTIPVTDITNTNILVNKTWYLDSNYEPPILTSLSTYYAAADRSLAGEAAEAFMRWNDAGRAVGVTFYAASAYRPYSSQEELYNRYKQSMGEAQTDALSARPGFSEHQTGYAVDLAATNEGDVEFKDTQAYEWNKYNCYDYGWILRYPEGKETITQYSFESWHYRYVGVDVAKAVQASSLTYDEFYSLYLKSWDDEANKPGDTILENSDWHNLIATSE